MWPKCEVCGGKGRIRLSIFDDDLNVVGYDEVGPCPACNGTGEAAELSADQAAEYLWRSGFIWLPDTNTDENVASGQVKRVILTIKKYDPERIHPKQEGDWRLWGFFEGDNLTAALNAAARAVKERGKE